MIRLAPNRKDLYAKYADQILFLISCALNFFISFSIGSRSALRLSAQNRYEKKPGTLRNRC